MKIQQSGMGGYQAMPSIAHAQLIVWISFWSSSDLLYRLNCHVDKQPVVGSLFLAGLWIAGNSRQGEQISQKSIANP